MQKIVYYGYNESVLDFLKISINNNTKLYFNWQINDTDIQDEINNLVECSRLLSPNFYFYINETVNWDEIDMMLLSIDVDRDNFAQKNSWIQKVVTEAVANGFNGIVVLDSNKDYLLINEILKYTGLSSRQVLGLGTSIESEVVARMVAKKLGINSNYIQTSVIGTRGKSFVLRSKGRVAEASLMSLIVQEKNMFSVKSMQEISREYKELAEKTRKLVFSSVLNKILMAMDTSEQFIITLVHSRNEEIESYSSPVLVGKMGVIELIKVNYTEDEQETLNEIKKAINDELDRYKLRWGLTNGKRKLQLSVTTWLEYGGDYNCLWIYAEVEKYNTNGVNREEFLDKYQDFLKVAPSKMLQKRLDREYEKLSGYSIYQSVKKVKENEKKFVKG